MNTAAKERTATAEKRQLAGGLAEMLDVRRVGVMLDCSERHVLRLADKGGMPAGVKIGALRRWARAEIEAWIAGGCMPISTATAKGGRR